MLYKLSVLYYNFYVNANTKKGEIMPLPGPRMKKGTLLSKKGTGTEEWMQKGGAADHCPAPRKYAGYVLLS